jgi:nucleotide-binding universal stress UspA family protein
MSIPRNGGEDASNRIAGAGPSVPKSRQRTVTRRIVVGVDGSEGSAKALDWAIVEAINFPARLELVTAWAFPMALGYAWTNSPAEVRREVQRMADSSVSYVAEVAPDVIVRSALHEAEAGPTLVDFSTGADLLVVGSRGHGGIRELLLGSVGTYCSRHARCPVVIVR